mgnify:FL=1
MEILLWVGKILFGGYFAMMGIMHFMEMKDMKAYTASKGIPLPGLATAVTGLMLLLGGLYIVFDFYFMLGGWLIIGFLVLASFMMHPFWKEEGAVKMADMTNFMKNMALAGAMLVIMFM